MDRKKITEKMKVAYHEAGHVVAAYLLKKKFEYVTIKQERDPVCGSYYRMGHVEYSDSPEQQNGHSVENEVIFHLAGGVAEQILSGDGVQIRALDSSFTDRMEASSILKTLNHDLENTNAHEILLEKLYRRCLDLLSRPRHWAAAEAVAETLMSQETIGYEQAEGLIRDAIGCSPENDG